MTSREKEAYASRSDHPPWTIRLFSVSLIMENEKILGEDVPQNDRTMRQVPDRISDRFADRKQKTGLTPAIACQQITGML